MKILVAEDNAFYAHMLEGALRGWGYEVVTARNGAEAWRVLSQPEHPRLAVIDWLMPELDGLELCRRVRAVGGREPTYLILLTGKGGKDDLVVGLQAGADDFIAKPFDPEELRVRIGVGRRILDLQTSLADRVRELEQALSGAQKMEAVGRLAGGVAHDFNNLLTVIASGSELLLQALRDPAQREYAEMIREAGERGAALTRQLLAFSRRQVLRSEVVDLNALVKDLERLLRRLIGEDIVLLTDLEPVPGCVRADPTQLQQVVLNLAVNARDAMPAGGRLTIQTRKVDVQEGAGAAFCEARSPAGARGWVPPGAYMMLAVGDTGCGMTDEVKKHLFEPFFTTKEKGKGTGLGLATVYGVVRQTGGHIVVESEPGQGTAFRVYLPRMDVPAPAAAAAGAPSTLARQETVLLVEDEEAVRSMVRQILQATGYTVLEARDGEDALQVSAGWTRGIDLMVTDVVMPQMDGPQLAGRMRSLRPDMKVLYMSGYPDDATVRQAVTAAGKPFLQKPFSPRALAARVREVLDE